MKKVKLILAVAFIGLALASCSSKYDNCMRFQIDEEGHSYYDACDICDDIEPSYI